jgi:hypothetical protein
MKILLVFVVGALCITIVQLKEELRQSQEESSKYLNGLVLGMNKGGYRIVIRDDVINVTCKAQRWTIDDERK